MAMVCTLGFFTACSSDDDDNDFKRNEKIEGTWRRYRMLGLMQMAILQVQ